jgi:glycosyltransferase involved in cell wall biosynthesis
MSHAVASQVIAGGLVASDSVVVLFHTDLAFPASPRDAAHPAPKAPLRLLFLGRILPYKGMALFLDTVDVLRARGIDVAPGVFGSGSLHHHRKRLTAMGAEVVNRWLSDREIGEILARHDALVASHTEASQSGTVAAALASGLPCVVTPVGGLIEQVNDGVTGVVAEAPTADALASAVIRLFSHHTYATVSENIAAQQPRRSMTRFVEMCVRATRDTL